MWRGMFTISSLLPVTTLHTLAPADRIVVRLPPNKMSKYCPILKRKTVYLDCLECEYKTKCNRNKQDKNKKKESKKDSPNFAK